MACHLSSVHYSSVSKLLTASLGVLILISCLNTGRIFFFSFKVKLKQSNFVFSFSPSGLSLVSVWHLLLMGFSRATPVFLPKNPNKITWGIKNMFTYSYIVFYTTLITEGCKEAGVTLSARTGSWIGRQPITGPSQRQTTIYTHFHTHEQFNKPVNLNCMSLGYVRNQDRPEETHTCMGITCKLNTKRHICSTQGLNLGPL